VSSLEPESGVSAAELARGLRLSRLGRRIIAEATSPGDFLNRLLAAGCGDDAARVLTRALPRRYAIAWTCQCIRSESRAKALSPMERECLEQAETWLHGGRLPSINTPAASGEESKSRGRMDPEDQRRQCAELAKAAGHETPAAWAAAAVGWSGGSLAPRGFAEVPPGEHLTAEACFAALALLAAADPAASRATLTRWTASAYASFVDAPAGAKEVADAPRG
jgi:hypothetical protein